MLLRWAGPLLMVVIGASSCSHNGPSATCSRTHEPPMKKVTEAFPKPVGFNRNVRAAVTIAHVALTARPRKLREVVRRPDDPCGAKRCEWSGRVRWRDEPSIARCSGVLVSPSLVLTATHCFDCRTCLDLEDARVQSVAGRKWVKVTAFRYRRNVGGGKVPLALLELAEPLGGVVADVRSKVPTRGGAYLVGSPLGIPGVYTHGALQRGRFDAFKARRHTAYVAEFSSGSPVFSSTTGALVGIQNNRSGCTSPRVDRTTDPPTLFFPCPRKGRSRPEMVTVVPRVISAIKAGDRVEAGDWREYQKREGPVDRSKMGASLPATSFDDPAIEVDWPFAED